MYRINRHLFENWIDCCAGFWVLLQRKPVSMWIELWVKTRYSRESWIWMDINLETHKWIRSLLYCRINTVNSTHWREYCSFIITESEQFFPQCHTEPQQFKVIKLNSKLKRHN